MTVKLLTEQHLELLSLKRGCTGSSQSTLVKIPHCWKSHVAAHLYFSGDSLSDFNGNKFSTKDKDNDGTNKDCAETHQGGWWYGNGEYCGPSSLNGEYYPQNGNPGNNGILWAGWRSSHSFKSTEIKIKRV